VITRGLLAEAVHAVFKTRGGTVETAALQRRIRVGFVTAGQLVGALEDAGVLGPKRNGRRPIWARDVEWGHRLVAEAIEDGRIQVTEVTQ
jgi:hypothetical protein